jgi:hypothetical protein
MEPSTIKSLLRMLKVRQYQFTKRSFRLAFHAAGKQSNARKRRVKFNLEVIKLRLAPANATGGEAPGCC